MIKGVNRQIIEVAETGNIYFEKAFLFVRPGIEEMDDNHLKNEAKGLVGRWNKPPRMKKYKRPIKHYTKTRRITNALFWSMFGASVFALFEYLLF